MESNGKSVDRDGAAGRLRDRPDHLGRARHQRPARLLPADPPGHRADPGRLPGRGAQPRPRSATTTRSCSANFFAQTEALAFGKTADEARAELERAGHARPRRSRRCCRTRCSPATARATAILYRRLDPATLGTLIALYEHKIFVQGVIWNINSLRPVGRRAGQAAGHRDPARAGRRRAGREPRRLDERPDQPHEGAARRRLRRHGKV